MSIETLKGLMPEYAKDIKLNLSSLAADETLSAQQLWGCFLASALASRNSKVIAEVKAEALDNLSETAYNAACAAAAVMAQNNVYYRFVHLASSGDYKTLPAKLRMNVMANPGVEKADFELWSLAVSAINGCGMCIDSHEAELRKHGISSEQIQTAVRVAATVHAAACVLDGEAVSAESVLAQAA
ncbi:MAG: carboxymuconolactone decarboxylase family protein [Alphaproteobacteria bacterium]|nr:carboxymuconolactone decarboxylase family protein [Alphaproteobacteria bacterium]MCD8520570.1 carboxymuconolactone decarboxylase family protein [Alphaproteobacteria bacterium]MCD8526463.1 carboxymuconolactone decarboxylase family protein [Alphaproteobacteria bacterium]MCD8571676.1 carboxymuconolactone decarboxylase family protein [Alphaproteobacteria bacterium]